MGSYYRVSDDKDTMAIFHQSDPTVPVTNWWNRIDVAGLASGESEYYIARRDDKMEAIFHLNDPKTPVSKWHPGVYYRGVVSGKSEYYQTKETDSPRFRLYRIGYPDSPIISGESLWVTQLLDGISNYVSVGDSYGKDTLYRVVNGIPEKVSKTFQEIYPPYYKSALNDEYYIVKDGTKYAIFSVTNPDTPVSEWFDYVFNNHLNKSEGKYFVAKKEIDGVMKIGLFSIDNSIVPISGWCKCITNIVNGRFVIMKEDSNYKAVFSIDDPTTPLTGWWKEIWEWGEI